MPVSTIRDLASVSTWREHLLPARFDQCLFHVESGAQEGGRRIVTHEFPKKDIPYSEDMGRKATEYTVRDYVIQFIYDTGVDLYKKDYTIARNKLQERLDAGGSGTLQLPVMKPLIVVCSRYRMTEEDKLGGFVAFDMTFVELGVPPRQGVPDASSELVKESENFRQQVLQVLTLSGPPQTMSKIKGPKVF